MIEQLGKDFVYEGDVRSMADYYDEIDETEDGPVIDEIISGIHSKQVEQVSAGDEQDAVVAFAQGVLLLVNYDERLGRVKSSIEQHPSMQNIPTQERSAIASEIIAAYQEEVRRLEHHKTRVNTSAVARSAFIAVIRNLDRLNVHEREEIAVVLGYNKDFFMDHPPRQVQPSSNISIPRELDWRERQANDDTLRGE